MQFKKVSVTDSQWHNYSDSDAILLQQLAGCSLLQGNYLLLEIELIDLSTFEKQVQHNGEE